MPRTLDHLAAEIRKIYITDPSDAPRAVETYLSRQLEGLSAEESHLFLANLQEKFAAPQLGSGEPPPTTTAMDDEILNRFCSLLLGPSVSLQELTPPEIRARFSASLNTVFDMLNQLIQAINATLFDTQDPEATIRHVIGRHMADENSPQSLEAYLGQIKTAFLTTQEAYKLAARSTVERLLSELDPQAMADADGKGFKFGPLRKGDYFDRYSQKYATCRKWFQSPRFMEDLSREFEKNCHRLSKQQRR
ncbi:MAG: hypothetical protein WBG37_07450 [Desulfobacterales bacterium]|jgi:hypothetical protein